MKHLVTCALMVSLSGCVTFHTPTPEGYAGPTARITDTFSNATTSTAHFFVLTRVDGKDIEDSGVRTRVVNSGRGFHMTPQMVSRSVTTEPQTFTIAGFVQFATDAQGLFGNDMAVRGDVTFTPVAGEEYRVEGTLSKDGSSVWIVDGSKQVVGDKVVDAKK